MFLSDWKMKPLRIQPSTWRCHTQSSPGANPLPSGSWTGFNVSTVLQHPHISFPYIYAGSRERGFKIYEMYKSHCSFWVATFFSCLVPIFLPPGLDLWSYLGGQDALPSQWKASRSHSPDDGNECADPFDTVVMICGNAGESINDTQVSKPFLVHCKCFLI